MTKIYTGQVSGNNLRFEFTNVPGQTTTRYMTSTVEFSSKDLESQFTMFEVRGQYKIGSKVQIELSIFEEEA